jgi:hypothetical protein
MLEKLKAAVVAAVEALSNNSEHRATLAQALTAAHDLVVNLEARVAELETKVNAGLQEGAAVAQTLGAVADAAAATQQRPAGATA